MQRLLATVDNFLDVLERGGHLRTSAHSKQQKWALSGRAHEGPAAKGLPALGGFRFGFRVPSMGR